MKLIAVNGSPRKTWNTAALLKRSMDGAASRGFDAELIHLNDLDFKGCSGCFACKLRGGKSYGKCALRDGLTPVLADIESADALVLGSPNYIGTPTGMMKNFIERLVYPYIVYDLNWSSLFKRKMPVGFIYTMSSGEPWMKQMGYDHPVTFIKNVLTLVFGAAELMIVNDTSMFDDYSRYVADRFDPAEKARIRAEQFPLECEKAFAMGAGLTEKMNRN